MFATDACRGTQYSDIATLWCVLLNTTKLSLVMLCNSATLKLMLRVSLNGSFPECNNLSVCGVHTALWCLRLIDSEIRSRVSSDIEPTWLGIEQVFQVSHIFGRMSSTASITCTDDEENVRHSDFRMYYKTV